MNDKSLGNLKVGQYLFSKMLSEGSQGRVYEVFHIQSKQRYACKVVNDKELRKSEGVKYLQREMNIMDTFDHPNILKLYEYLRCPFNHYLVLDYCERGQHFIFMDSFLRLFSSVSSPIFAIFCYFLFYCPVRTYFGIIKQNKKHWK